jgi:hypothetical protein
MSEPDALVAKSGKSIKSFVREFINDRIKQVNADPSLKDEGRLTLSTCFYHIRPELLRAGIKFAPSTRKTIQVDYIKEICEERGYKRADLGIIAADRAEFYFKGGLYNVGVDAAYSSLADNGTDVLIIEKEGVVEALGPYADKYGIALMYTRGFPSEYAKELSEYSGANVALLTDYDPAGVMIGEDLSSIPRIGVDFETLEYLFNIESDAAANSEIVEKLQEVYPGTKDTHLISLWNSGHPAANYFVSNPNNNQRRRIEIDSVLKEVGNNRFWDFVIHKLRQLFPSRDYTRVIDIDDEANITPRELSNLIVLVEKKVKTVLWQSVEDYNVELSEYQGFITNIDLKKREIYSDFNNQLNDDEQLGALLKAIGNLVERYNGENDKDNDAA